MAAIARLGNGGRVTRAAVQTRNGDASMCLSSAVTRMSVWPNESALTVNSQTVSALAAAPGALGTGATTWVALSSREPMIEYAMTVMGAMPRAARPDSPS